MPSDFSRANEDNEKVYFEVIEKVKKEINIPVSIKVSYYFSNLGVMLQKLSETGIDGLVLFNRFYSPDFDIDNMKIVPAPIYSSPDDLSISLRWISIMANRVKCCLAASTGVHNGEGLIKQILAGADAVQVVSTLYKNGFSRIQKMIDELSEWMQKKEYDKLDEFRGKMSQSKSSNPAAFERVQFMKHFSKKG
jgi:dihydroorotate dehydrogenase (fumarate)